ncbi:MAG: calcium-binding protein, partial [Flavobacteriaceae bacterium]|nr:calcium-binding protein [Flavobacteriaceae bacterium]
MNKKPILLLLFLILSQLSYSQSPTNNVLDLLLEPFNSTANIEGRVYLDINGNGIQDPDEPGIEGVSVIIINANNVGLSTVTDVDGNWNINVIGGTTNIFISNNTLPEGALKTQGEDPNIVTAIENETVNVEPFGYFLVGSLEGRVYKDVNGNGTQDLDEAGIEGVDINITDEFGNESTAITDINGDWFIDEIGAGEVTIDINQNSPNFPTGAVQTEGTDPKTVTLTPAQTLNVGNDGFFESGLINGTLYLDSNGNGTQDIGEDGIANITITIENSLGEIQTETTDANGNWSVLVPEGEVTITIDEAAPNFPEGAVQTEGENPTIFNVINGEEYSQNDGFYQFGILEGVVYLDENANGVQDIGEVGIDNISIEITTSGGDLLTTTTDSNGNWSIEVPIGETIVQIDENQAGFPPIVIQTEGTNPTIQNIEVNQINTQTDGFAEAGILEGIIYLDENANGTQDADETGIPNINVEVTSFDGNTQIVTSDANGNWQATVFAGETTSFIDTNQANFPENAVQTEGTNPTTSTIIAGETISEIDGFFVLDEQTGQLTGNIYNDENGNGTQDANENGIGNVEVLVTDVNGDEQIVTTDATGNFFAIVPEGETTYLINENEPDFPIGAIQTEGTNPTEVFVASDTNTFGGDNGFFVPNPDLEGQLSAHLYFDDNGNGTQDPGEPDMPNVQVLVTDPFGDEQIVTTDANGNFTVDVPAGINV